MSFKRLNSGDFSLSVAPIITQIDPVPTPDSELYDSAAGNDNPSKKIHSSLSNLVGSANMPSSGKVLSFDRADFRQSIHPESFKLNGISINSGSGDIAITTAGRKYTASDSSYNLYPDVGLVIAPTAIATSVDQFCSEESLTTAYVTIRILPSEFNYSTNPSFAANGDTQVKDPYLLNPVTYITTIGLYNDNNELLAVAKTEKPLKKDFVTSYSLNVQLDF